MIILAATPIGNLADASPRVVEALTTARFIAAEDTRTTHKLAQALGITLQAKLFSLNEQNEGERLAQLIDLARSEDLLVVSDAGMPTVSDPGFQLVRAATEASIEVTVIPGPSAVIAALAVSGLPTDRFTFEGFVPRKSGERIARFKSLVSEPRTMVFFEAPHRILETLEDAVTVFGSERAASVSRELTKKFEQTYRATLSELTDWAKTEPKGEMVLLIAGSELEIVEVSTLVPQVLKLAEEIGLKQAVAEIAAASKVSKSELYQASLDARN